MYAEDATYIGTAGDVTQSKDKIQMGLKGSLPYFRGITATPVEFGSSGDLASELGTYSQRLEVPGRAPETFAGKYLFIFRRQADGLWKIQVQIVTRDRPQQ
jgi:ketosteroid isomerase-like protein